STSDGLPTLDSSPVFFHAAKKMFLQVIHLFSLLVRWLRLPVPTCPGVPDVLSQLRGFVPQMPKLCRRPRPKTPGESYWLRRQRQDRSVAACGEYRGAVEAYDPATQYRFAHPPMILRSLNPQTF